VRIVFYTSGITGAGRLVFGISIGNALNRKGVKYKYTIVHTSPVAHLADDFHHIKIPLENETELSEKNYHKSILYKTLIKLKPDILIVNHTWFMIYNFINQLNCKKIYLSDYVYDQHFKVPLHQGEMTFKPDHYDRIIAIEPFRSHVPMESINPLIIRNHDEIFSREKALKQLGFDGSKKIALQAFSGNPEYQDRFMEKYSNIGKDYEIVKASLFSGGIFPIVDYYNAFDFMICSGGYNLVWDAVYFNKNAVFEPVPVNFCDQRVRIKKSQKFTFTSNGADQLSNIIQKL